MTTITKDFQFPDTAKVSGARGRGPRAAYPFSELEVGDGFEVEGDAKKIKSVKSILSNFRRKNPSIVLQSGVTENAIFIKRVG